MGHRQKSFGKYHHIGEFLNHYKKQTNNERVDSVQSANSGDLKSQVAGMKQPILDVVEVQATIEQFFGDQHEHYQFYINVNSIVTGSTDSAINDDINNCIKNKSNIFLAVRYGDNEGLSQPIKENLAQGDPLHLKGQWIPADKAYSHGGDKTSVLHFTHHPIGFICVQTNCYS